LRTSSRSMCSQRTSGLFASHPHRLRVVKKRRAGSPTIRDFLPKRIKVSDQSVGIRTASWNATYQGKNITLRASTARRVSSKWRLRQLANHMDQSAQQQMHYFGRHRKQRARNETRTIPPEPPPLVIADAIQDSRLDPITVCEQPHVRFQNTSDWYNLLVLTVPA